MEPAGAGAGAGAGAEPAGGTEGLMDVLFQHSEGSLSPSTHDHKYDVYIRGLDTRDGFTDHLHRTLVDANYYSQGFLCVLLSGSIVSASQRDIYSRQFIPCLPIDSNLVLSGGNQKEKHVLLPSVVIEQGYLQSCYGVYSIRIENVGVRRAPTDDVQIEGIANPQAFRKAAEETVGKLKSPGMILVSVNCSVNGTFKTDETSAEDINVTGVDC